MVIRYILWSRHEAIDDLGTFRPRLTKEQIEQFESLYRVLSDSTSDVVDVEVIAPIIHRILFQTFARSLNPNNLVDSALEQSLIFSSLSLEDGKYIRANIIQHYLACIQRTCFSTFFHVARLGGTQSNYRMAEKSQDDDNCEEGEEDVNIDVEDHEDAVGEMMFRRPRGVGHDGPLTKGGMEGSSTKLFDCASDSEGSLVNRQLFDIAPQGDDENKTLR
jgi:hypothetical protein